MHVTITARFSDADSTVDLSWQTQCKTCNLPIFHGFMKDLQQKFVPVKINTEEIICLSSGEKESW